MSWHDHRVVLACVLAGVVAAVTILVFFDAPKVIVALLQAAGTVGGAYLGNVFQKDRERLVQGTHVRVSVRALLDLLARLKAMVIAIDAFRERLAAEGSVENKAYAARVDEKLYNLGEDMRQVLDGTISATENWRDVNALAYDEELVARESRTRGNVEQWAKETKGD